MILLIEFILKLEPSIGRVSTGKGEILLSVMLKDVQDAVSGGDIEAGGKEIEVKNKGAVPMGQKAEFGTNTMETVYTDIEKGINPREEVSCEIKYIDGSSKTIKLLSRIDTENEIEYYKPFIGRLFT